MRATTPEDIIHEPADALPAPPSPPDMNTQGRQKSSASIQSFNPSPFLAKVSIPPTPATFDVIRDVRSLYVVPDGVMNPGVVSNGYREGLKRKADSISRSQYEVYSFATKHNLSEAAVNELLEMLSNVSCCLIPEMFLCILIWLCRYVFALLI
jgi:hypothetical protein